MLFASPRGMELFNLIAALLTLSAASSYVNYRWLRMPAAIGMMAAALVFSLALIGAGHFWPAVEDYARAAIGRVPLDRALLHGMLGFLLFAGSLHVNLNDVLSEKAAIGFLATIGVLISTLVVGLLAWLVLHWVGLETRLIHCFLFGALISPTDPVAVIDILKQVGAPKQWETIIAGESLFNDGIGVVVFVALLEIATGTRGFSLEHLVYLFIREAIGGVGLGLVLGLIAYRLLKSIDQYQVEVMMTLALVAGGYGLAESLSVSGPLAMVVAGLFIGNRGRTLAMSDSTRKRLDVFWELVDEILNSVLFVLVGLELMRVRFTGALIVAGLAMVPVVLAARLASVGLSAGWFALWRRVSLGAVGAFTWSGLRGGISLAMALSLHSRLRASSVPDLILPVTYVVVVFSVLVQGSTMRWGMKRLLQARRSAGLEVQRPAAH